jgi:hypothetical protein
MAKHLLFLHIGPTALAPGPEGLASPAASGVRVPDVTADDLDRADTEIRRRHRAVGVRRRDVEGAWARVCRRIHRSRSDAFVSLPGFWEADAHQAALAVDGVHGLRVHLVVTADAGELPEAWTRLVKPGRTHALGAGATSVDVVEQVIRIVAADERARPDKGLVRLGRRRPKGDQPLAA